MDPNEIYSLEWSSYSLSGDRVYIVDQVVYMLAYAIQFFKYKEKEAS